MSHFFFCIGQQGLLTSSRSLGCVLYTMLTGNMPYPPPEDGNPSSVLREIRTTQLTFPPELSSGVVDLLKRMMEPEVKDRIRLYEVRNHPWLLEHRSEALTQNSSFESLPSMSSSPSLSSYDDLISPRSDENGEKEKEQPMSAPTSPTFFRLMVPAAHPKGDLESAQLTQKDV